MDVVHCGGPTSGVLQVTTGEGVITGVDEVGTGGGVETGAKVVVNDSDGDVGPVVGVALCVSVGVGVGVCPIGKVPAAVPMTSCLVGIGASGLSAR